MRQLRQRFIHATLGVIALIVASGVRAEDAPKSRIVVARDATAVNGFDVDTAKVRMLVAAGMKSLTGAATEAAAWASFASTNDIVGIKINTQAAPLHGTHTAVVEAIAAGLRSAGVAPTNLIVWGRDKTRIQAAGFALADEPTSTQPFRVVAVIPDGWDPENFFENRLVGRLIWGDLMFRHEGEGLNTRSHLPKLVTRTITKLINVPVLQDSDACGLGGCLYNMSIDAVDNTRRFETFGQHGDPAIAEIFSLPAVRGKVVLNIMDALVGGFAGGPTFKPQYSWNEGALFFSRDPVAVDVLALALIESKRQEAKITALGSMASHVATAAKIGLGQNKTEHLELVEIAP